MRNKPTKSRIAWAYPTSTRAIQAGKSKDGTYVVEVLNERGNEMKAHTRFFPTVLEAATYCAEVKMSLGANLDPYLVNEQHRAFVMDCYHEKMFQELFTEELP
jgi:hypothetical protein